jgi:hypothetical protein
MTTEEKTLKTLHGVLMRPLTVGAKAIIVHEGRITLTSRVVSIHSRTVGEVCFETLNSEYHLLTGPFCQPAVSQSFMAMAA